MNAFIEATKWPMGFEPDDTTSLLQCTIVNERTSVGTSVGQHVHQTGQFVVALSGLVGLALGRNRIAFPPSSAAWVPPGCRHEGFLGEGAVSLYCHINPEWAAAPKLPISFVLFPDHPALKRIAESIIQSPQLDRPVASWAQETAMSERTLARLVLKETGLSFGAWRLKIAMLTATQKLLAGERAEEVAAYLGYAAPSAFSSAFRRVFGTSPSTFRNAELSLRKNSPPKHPITLD